MNLAILMTCHNRRKMACACLAAIGRQQLPEGVIVQVILVDDGSSDGTTEAVMEQFPQVEILKGDGTLFWNGGMRKAFSAAVSRGFDSYLLINDDTVLMEDALSRLIEVHQSAVAQTGREVLVVGTTECPLGRGVTYGGFKKGPWWKPLALRRVFPEENASAACDTFNGNCVLISNLIADRMGILDCAFTHGMGDIDYGLRAAQHGFGILVAPGFIGECALNLGEGSWTDARLSSLARWSLLTGPKGLPPQEWFALTRRHGGPLWPMYWLNPYLRFWVNEVWRHLKAPQTSSALDVNLSEGPIYLDNTVVEESEAANTAIEHFLPKPPLLQRLYVRFVPDAIRHRLISVVRDWFPEEFLRQLRRMSWHGWGISFGGPILDSFADYSWSQEGEDQILRRLFGEKATGLYVDVGAHHPRRFSNTYLFYKRGWRGINIDAMPGSMQSFNKVRPHDINLEVGIAEQKAKLDFYIFNEPALNGFQRDLSQERHVSESAYLIKDVVKVDVLPLHEVLDQYMPVGQSIDFMSVDVEGLDLQVLKSNDWTRYRPTYVLAEALGSSFHEVEKSEIGQFMLDKGYSLYAKCVNTVFFRET